MKKIAKLRERQNTVEHGFVSGSNKEFPYQKKSFHVSGYNIFSDEKRRYKIQQFQIAVQGSYLLCATWMG